MTFMTDVAAGRASYADIFDYIAEWKKQPEATRPELHTYLGMTAEQYQTWVEDSITGHTG